MPFEWSVKANQGSESIMASLHISETPCQPGSWECHVFQGCDARPSCLAPARISRMAPHKIPRALKKLLSERTSALSQHGALLILFSSYPRSSGGDRTSEGLIRAVYRQRRPSYLYDLASSAAKP